MAILTPHFHILEIHYIIKYHDIVHENTFDNTQVEKKNQTSLLMKSSLYQSF